jgi:hypothetical protein
LLLAPARRPTPIPVGPVLSAVQYSDSTATEKDNTDTGSGVETEIEWTADAQLAELALRVPSEVSEAILIEVHQRFRGFFFLT